MLTPFFRLSVASLALAATLAWAPTPAQSEPLLATSTRAEEPATEAMRQHAPGLVTHRFYRLNLTTVGRVMGIGPKARAASRLDTVITLTLKPGVTATFERSFREVAPDGTVTWSGRQVGDTNGSAVFVSDRGQVIGQIQVGDRVYRLAPAGGGLTRVSEFELSGFPEDIVRPVPTPRSDLAPQADDTARATTPITYIRLMMVYTRKASRGAWLAGTSITAETNLAFALANTGFVNSGLNVRLQNAGVIAAPSTYNEDAASYDAGLTALTSGSVFAAARSQRNARRADLVALMREAGAYCGIAWMIPNPSAATAGYGYSVFTRGCITNLSFAHEVGHNIGLNHDRYVVATKPAGTYNYGYVNLSGRVRSIMAYNNACADRGFNCTRVNMFSTPLRRFQGKVIGTAADDSARMIRRNAARIAAYR